MFEDFVLFFQTFKSLNDYHFENDKNDYSNIFKEIHEISESGLLEVEIWSNTYNIFNILKIEKNEDETHSPFLLDLLNIRGSHCQRDLFYRLFLERIFKTTDERLKYFPDNPLYFSITGQKSICDDTYGLGFLDIFIDYVEPGKKSFSIVIENKIYHGDGDDQLIKYYSFLESLYRDNILLIYLTPTGKPPYKNSIKPNKVKELIELGTFKLISYQEDIESVIRKSLEPECIKSDKVRFTLYQYLTLIYKILNKPVMESYEEKLCKYLTSSVENFNYSKKIFELFNDRKIHQYLKSNYLMNFLYKVRDNIIDQKGGWESEVKGNLSYVDLLIYKKDWNGVCVGLDVFENEIGISLLDGEFDKEWKTKIMMCPNTPVISGFKDFDNPHWLWYMKFTFDLNDVNVLFNLTDSYSEILSKDLSHQLVDFSKKYENHILDINSQRT